MVSRSAPLQLAGPPSRLAQCIESQLSEGPVRIVGLDGRSGCGKSTLAGQLGALLGATVIAGDDFYAGGTEVHVVPAHERAALCIDLQRLVGVLRTLRAGEPALWHAFDWERFDGSLCASPSRVEPGSIVLLEGVYTCDPRLHDHLDLRIRVHVGEDRRQRQFAEREGVPGPWERQWWEAEEWYFSERMPPERFDIGFTPDLRNP